VASSVLHMDVNYSRWMSTDPDAEPEEPENEPRRFTLPRPARSVVASGALVALIALSGGAYVRSITTATVSADQTRAVEAPTDAESEGPGAAEIDESTSYGSVSDDDRASDSSESDDETVDDPPSLPGPRVKVRREVREANGVPPSGPWSDHPRHDDRRGPAPEPPRLGP
jgi:hypothetical protein